MYKSILGILGCTGVYWNVKEYTGMCKRILKREIVYWDIKEYIGMYKRILGCTREYWDVQEYANLRFLLIVLFSVSKDQSNIMNELSWHSIVTLRELLTN